MIGRSFISAQQNATPGLLAADKLDEYFVDTGEWTGFVNRTDSTIAFADATQIFTLDLAVAGTPFVVWIGGTRIEYSVAETVDISAAIAEGLWYFYLEGIDPATFGQIKATQVFSTDLITRHAWAASIYWDNTNALAIYLGDERHGMVMDSATHLAMHQNFHTRWVSGLTLNNVTATGSGAVDADAELGVANGSIRDEDILHTITTGAPQVLAFPAQIPVFYRTGADASRIWRMRATGAGAPFPTLYDGDGVWVAAAGRIPFNKLTIGNWSLQEVANNSYVLIHLFATNDVDHPVIAIQGQATYATKSELAANAVSELNNIFLNGFPFSEAVALATIALQTDGTVANTPNAWVVQPEPGIDYYSWLGLGLSAAGIVPVTSSLDTGHTGITTIPAPAIGNTFDVDLDGGPLQVVTVTDAAASIIPSVSGLAAATGKEVRVRVINGSGAVLNWDFTGVGAAADWHQIGFDRTLPPTIQIGAQALLSIVTFGSAQTDVFATYVEETP